jgi:hypothetical protein
VRAEQQPVLPKPRAKAAAEMESELKPLAVASVTPVWAISCVRAEQQPVLPWPRTMAAAEMENELKLLAAASVMPGRAISCVRRAAACAAHSERESSGRGVKRAEVANGGELHARQGNQLQARQEAACASQADGGLRHARQGDQL